MVNRTIKLLFGSFYLAQGLAFRPIMIQHSSRPRFDHILSRPSRLCGLVVFLNDNREDEPEIVMLDGDADEGDLPDDVLDDLEAGQPSELTVLKEVRS